MQFNHRAAQPHHNTSHSLWNVKHRISRLVCHPAIHSLGGDCKVCQILRRRRRRNTPAEPYALRLDIGATSACGYVNSMPKTMNRRTHSDSLTLPSGLLLLRRHTNDPAEDTHSVEPEGHHRKDVVCLLG